MYIYHSLSKISFVSSFRRDNAQVAQLLGLSEEVGILSMEGNNNPRDRSQVQHTY